MPTKSDFPCPETPRDPTPPPEGVIHTEPLPRIKGRVVLCRPGQKSTRKKRCQPIRTVREPQAVQSAYTTSAAKSPCARSWMTKSAREERRAAGIDDREVCPVEIFYKEGRPGIRLCTLDVREGRTARGDKKIIPQKGKVLLFDTRLEAQQAAKKACDHWAANGSWSGYADAKRAKLGSRHRRRR
jgi:hypothetical protein